MNDAHANHAGAFPNAARMLIIDDDDVLLSALPWPIKRRMSTVEIDTADCPEEALAHVYSRDYDVIVSDIRMPRMDGVTATRHIKWRWPDIQLLVLTTFDDDALVFRSIEAGACGYLLKDVGSDALAEAVRAASRGDAPLQPSVARKILGRLRSPAPVTPPPLPEPGTGEGLSDRELAVLRLLGQGAPNREIAHALALTEGTVKNYVSAILAKTGLHDRTQAALFAVRHHLTDRDSLD